MIQCLDDIGHDICEHAAGLLPIPKNVAIARVITTQEPIKQEDKLPRLQQLLCPYESR